MTTPNVSLKTILAILEALQPGDDILHLWHEIGRVQMEAKIGLGKRGSL